VADDIPAEAVEADHYHPCDGLLCAPGEWLSDLGRHGGPVRMADLRARVLAEVDAALAGRGACPGMVPAVLFRQELVAVMGRRLPAGRARCDCTTLVMQGKQCPNCGRTR
jgi:hypothetical protein